MLSYATMFLGCSYMHVSLCVGICVRACLITTLNFEAGRYKYEFMWGHLWPSMTISSPILRSEINEQNNHMVS